MENEDTISHKEIYERLITLETKVDNIDRNTENVVKAFNAASGAFTVLEWISHIVKPIIIVVTICGGIYVAIHDKIR